MSARGWLYQAVIVTNAAAGGHALARRDWAAVAMNAASVAIWLRFIARSRA